MACCLAAPGARSASTLGGVFEERDLAVRRQEKGCILDEESHPGVHLGLWQARYMILDTSAVIAILTHEPVADVLIGKIARSDSVAMGVPTVTETGIVLASRHGFKAISMVSRFIQEFRVEQIPFSELHWQVAVDAYMRFGKGRHPAQLNFGDCLAYAVAHLSTQPLLFVGSDFSKTDIVAG